METRLRDLEQEVRAVRQQQPAALYPLERWHGRTYSATPSSYPASGNTFEVQLLDAHFTATPGTQAVTEAARGDIVVARTWPGTYLARDTEVECWRKRGMGALGAGEWWITTPKATFTNRAWTGIATHGLDYGDTLRKEFGHQGNFTSPNIRMFPQIQEFPTPDPPVVEYLQPNFGPHQHSPAITALKDGIYLIWLTCKWELPTISAYDHRLIHDTLFMGATLDPSFGHPGGGWNTGSPTAGTSHTHPYWPYIPFAILSRATLTMTRSRAGFLDESVTAEDTLPFSAVHTGTANYGAKIGTFSHSWLWSLAAGDTLTFDLDARHNLPGYSVLAAYRAFLHYLSVQILKV